MGYAAKLGGASNSIPDLAIWSQISVSSNPLGCNQYTVIPYSLYLLFKSFRVDVTSSGGSLSSICLYAYNGTRINRSQVYPVSFLRTDLSEIYVVSNWGGTTNFIRTIVNLLN